MERKIYIHHQPKGMTHHDSNEIESKRRSLLKYVLFGGGFFMLGKIFGPSINIFSQESDLSITDFKNFRVVESGKELQFFDKMGNEILALDKEA